MVNINVLRTLIVIISKVLLGSIFLYPIYAWANAAPQSSNEEILINADSIDYSKEGIVVASGNVEVHQGGNILTADKITYYKQQNLVVASGNVILLQNEGDVIFADELEIKDDMKSGLAENFRARLADNSVLAAASGKILDKGLYELNQAVFSPCPICKDRSPQWQIKASKAIINESQAETIYKHARFELYGIPVLYSPYFSYPLSNAKRRSGFLPPSIGHITDVGTTIKIPYYFNIAPDKEAIVAPIYTSQAGIVWSGEYNQLTKYGLYSLKGTYNKSKDKLSSAGRLKEHTHFSIDSKGDFTFTPEWSGGFKVKQSSDKNYLRKFHFSTEDYLTSAIYTDYIKNRNSASVEFMHFQGLRPIDDKRTTPLIAPIVNSHVESDTFSNGSKLFADSNLLILTRDIGARSNRLSLTGGWELPHITDNGHLLSLKTNMRGDFYKVTNVAYDVTNPSHRYNGTVHRFIPEAKLNWQMPMVKHLKNYDVLINPIADFIVSPYASNNSKIPNEDSQYVEITDGNLLRESHYPGIDRIESGPRTNYGVNTAIYTKDGRHLEIFLGQNYRARHDKTLTAASGMSNNFSDYVGRINLRPLQMLDLTYKFRLNQKTMDAKRNEAGVNFYLSPVTLSVNYVTIDSNLLDNKQGSNKQMFVNTTIDITKHWKIGGSARRNLSSHNKRFISTAGNIIYDGDCLYVHFSITRDYTQASSINRKPSIVPFIVIIPKNLM